MNHELAKTLTTALVQWIDRERTEGTMCCSTAECERLEKAFEVYNLDFVERFMDKKLSGLTEFEQALSNYLKNDFEYFHTQKWDTQKWDDVIRTQSKELFALAKKELARRDEVITLDNLPPYDKGFQDGKVEAIADLERNFKCVPAKLPGWLIEELNKAFKRGQESSHEDYVKGYTNGYKDAEEKYNEQTSYHFPPITVRPLCYEPGGTCTNPHFDCINCPKKTTGGIFTSPNTATSPNSVSCGTSTPDGNTSFTDGKPHNPSFTD